MQDQDRLLPERRRQDTSHVFYQFLQAQHRVQTVLTKPSLKLSFPRFFVVLLSRSTVVDDGQGESQPPLRLYFLCECGSHTMDKDCKKPHEVHLVNHPGYDLINQDELINKYGPYLLTMLYMVKYGAKARGLVVPPLLGLNHTIGQGESISQLVDDTITHLKEATVSIGGDTTAQCGLDATELTALKSHLKAKDGESFSGSLSRIKTQDGHYAWICSEHLREYYELTLQQLRQDISTSGGVWHGNELKVKAKSGAMSQSFCDNLDRLLRIQDVENWRSITEMELKVGRCRSTSGPTMDTLESLRGLETLSLDLDRFTISTRDIFRGHEIKDVAIFIRDPGAPTLDDLEFIQKCRPVTLAISETPSKKYDNRLTGILYHNRNIASLQIVCGTRRHIPIIDLMSSTREKMLQSGIEPALRMPELVHPQTKMKVSFDEDAPALEMTPCIDLGKCQSYIVDSVVYNTIRQHGWSAITFVVPATFSDVHAKLLDESMQENGSRIARFDITPTSLTSPGLEAMNRVIDQSQGLTYLRLCLENLSTYGQEDRALSLLRRHKDRLTSLRLGGVNLETWLPKSSDVFEDGGFPVLEEFFVESSLTIQLRNSEQQYHGQSYYSAQRNNRGQQPVQIGNSLAQMVNAISRQKIPLKVIGADLNLPSQYWASLIQAIDLSTLEELHLNTNFIQQSQLTPLADRIASSGVAPLPLKVLDFKGDESQVRNATREVLARIQEKAPQVKIHCNNQALADQ